MKMKAKWMAVCAIVVLALAFAGCGDGKMAGGDAGKAGKPVELTVLTNANPSEAGVLQKIVDNFNKENLDIKVNLSAPGSEYENIMKVKMASNDMPDLFATHGWAIIRYGNFLADLKNEPWAAQVDDGIKSLVTDDKGKLYILPMNQEKASVVYNVDVLKKYGVEPPLTFDDFLQACEVIKTKSNGEVSPVYVGGGDDWTLANMFDQLANPAFITPESGNSRQELLNGTFDTAKWTKLAAAVLDMHKKGYFNKDILTAKYVDISKAFAEGKAAFGFFGAYVFDEAKKSNPDVHMGVIPVPSMAPGDKATWIGGEHSTLGIWKDTKHMAEAKKFLAYMAKPENIKAISENQKCLPGLKGVTADLGDVTPFYEKYKDARTFPFFDRVYLPNGMWDVMIHNSQDMIAGAITPEQFSQNMKSEYGRLRAAASK